MNKFQTLFAKSYEELDAVVERYTSDNQRILDIGSNDGAIAGIIDKYHRGCIVYCVDIDTAALDALAKRRFDHTITRIYNEDANQFMSGNNLQDLDAIVINAALHEINTPDDQPGYLNSFFGQCRKKMRPDGKVIIGDYYYPDHVSDEEVLAYMARQLAEIGHADPRHKFVNPQLVMKTAGETGFEPVFFSEIPAVEGIDRRYYAIVLKRGE